MDTFTEPRAFVFNPRYQKDRSDTIVALDLDCIDEPVVDIVAAFSMLPYCFTLQSCFGHFICTPKQDIHTLDSIPKAFNDPVRYRIAYIALCIENNSHGWNLYNCLSEIQTVDPVYIQFGSADWFWDHFANSYVLQVDPPSHMEKDEATLEPGEGKHVEKVRNRFFNELRNRISKDL